jgi:hypothetical protein
METSYKLSKLKDPNTKKNVFQRLYESPNHSPVNGQPSQSAISGVKSKAIKEHMTMQDPLFNRLMENFKPQPVK